MFLGEYQTNFSGKGRIILPKKFRQELNGEQLVVLSRGFEKCIWGFTVSDFEKEAQKQLDIPVTDRKARDIRRYLFSGAEAIGLDDQGRIVIPGTLMEYAGLRNGAVVIGAGDHFEIWDPGAWEELIKRIIEKSETG